MKNAVILIPTDLSKMDRITICRALRDRITTLYREWFIYYNRDLHLAHSPDTELTEDHIRRSLDAYKSVDPDGLTIWIDSLSNRQCKETLRRMV